MAKSKTAAPHAVYRGQDVKLFSSNLSNYAELRRGLSPAMRAQTMTTKELRNASPDMVKLYINSLNDWRQSPQREKIVRGQANEITKLESMFQRKMQSGAFSANDKAALAAANFKMKSIPQEQARMEIREALNAIDRVHSGDWYKPQDYWAADFYMSHGEWDPGQASDSMLRLALQYDLVGDYPAYADETKEEYARRLGSDFADSLMASEINTGNNDVLAIAKLFLQGR